MIPHKMSKLDINLSLKIALKAGLWDIEPKSQIEWAKFSTHEKWFKQKTDKKPKGASTYDVRF